MYLKLKGIKKTNRKNKGRNWQNKHLNRKTWIKKN
jgi:hypothetical protein